MGPRLRGAKPSKQGKYFRLLNVVQYILSLDLAFSCLGRLFLVDLAL